MKYLNNKIINDNNPLINSGYNFQLFDSQPLAFASIMQKNIFNVRKIKIT